MDAAWDLSKGIGITVAVLDTGIATLPGTDNPTSYLSDGLNCITSPHNTINGSPNVEDGDGHGTHVSGTVAQATNNNIGVAGIAYEACIMPVKVLDDSGSGSFADIAEGIYFAANNGARVINMSLGTNAKFAVTSDPVMDAAIDHAIANNVVVVAASGNDSYRKNVSYPAIYPPVIAVGSTGFDNSVVRYSNKGTGLDIVAPGGDTSKDANGDSYADGILNESRVNGSWGYYFFQGTSMASPHVAAVAALVISNNPTFTVSDVEQALTVTALDLYESGYDKTSGAGLVQAHDAILWMPGVTEPPEPPSQCTDNDGDGVCLEDGDCDDNNAQIFPGANDSRGRKGRDGIDNDCNDIVDG